MKATRPFPGSLVGPIILRIVSSTEQEENGIGQNRWDYQVRYANYRDGSDYAAVSTAPAFNVWEKNNDAATAMGVDTGTLPGTYALQPCPDGAFVLGYYGTEGDGFLFLWPNQFDGAC